MKRIRNAAKALIVRDDHLLTIKKVDDEGFYYILPGGGQEAGESLADTLRRECREELDADVVVHDLILMREYIGKNHEFSQADAEVHQIEFMFMCDLASEGEVHVGSEPDPGQVGTEWIPLTQLAEMRFYPKALRTIIGPSMRQRDVVYCGDLN